MRGREMQAQAEAMKAYLESKLSRVSEEARAAAELLLRVKRRIGELLPPLAKGGRGKKTVRDPDGLPRQRRAELRKLAKQPEAAFESYVAECRERGVPPSASGATKAASSSKAAVKPTTEPDPGPATETGPSLSTEDELAA